MPTNYSIPNPNSGNAMLILNNLNKQEITNCIYDSKGIILVTETGTNSRFALPNNDWNTDHYFIESIRENGSERSKRADGYQKLMLQMAHLETVRFKTFAF